MRTRITPNMDTFYAVCYRCKMMLATKKLVKTIFCFGKGGSNFPEDNFPGETIREEFSGGFFRGSICPNTPKNPSDTTCLFKVILTRRTLPYFSLLFKQTTFQNSWTMEK